MVTTVYNIEGMTCSSCITRIQNALNASALINSAVVQLDDPQAEINSSKPVDIKTLQSIMQTAGPYTISAVQAKESTEPLAEPVLQTYKPLLLIVAFIASVSWFAQFHNQVFSSMLWMRHFMAGFFIVFSFFKLLNIKGFAQSYSMYDLIAMKWTGWGYLYPFIELTLGILYLTNTVPIATNLSTAVILSISSIGVIKSNLDKKKIKCACLGDVFNLPMSTVTIVEDLTMVAMSIIMLSTYRML